MPSFFGLLSAVFSDKNIFETFLLIVNLPFVMLLHFLQDYGSIPIIGRLFVLAGNVLNRPSHWLDSVFFDAAPIVYL